MFRISKKNTILLLWYKEGNNLGDYYIYKTVVSLLDKWGYFYTDIDVGLPYNKIACKARKCDFLWFIGGGIIERWIPDVIRNFSSFHKKSKSIRYGITGLSIGDFDYNEYIDELKYWTTNSVFFFVRDNYTSDYLNAISNSKSVKTTADIVFAYPLNNVYREYNSDYAIGVNFRDLPYVDLSGEFKWDKWNEKINRINNVRIIPDQHNELLKYDLYFDKEYSPEKALQVISKCDIVIAMRYHVLLFAARMKKFIVPINYCPKVERLAKQLGVEGYTIGVHDYNKLDSVIEKLKNDKLYYNTLQKNVTELENSVTTMLIDIKHILREELINEG